MSITNKKYAIPYKLKAPMSNVKLTGGRFKKAFENNISFLKGFELDRILYWYRVHKGKAALGVPYAAGRGHFENNLKGQTAGEFLMGACTTLLWQEDQELRQMSQELIKEMEACRDDDGFIIPITKEEFKTKEYPNYTRAWITFGLLDAGYAGEKRAFKLARDMGDWFNTCEVLPYVKDMNLGFQGILANTRLYDSEVGVAKDIEIAKQAYEETWWLKQLIKGDHRAIYKHPGNHPHSTLLTTLEAYLDLYRVTGEQIYIDAVKSALTMYEDKWQHVGGGINMCEYDTYYPGCNWLSPEHTYNELCSTNFWILLNQRMHLLEPDNPHYVDEIENSLYNILLASQVDDMGYHYLNFLQRSKDTRWTDRCTCCASLGTRLVGLLPQFLYSYDESSIYVDIYAPSTAQLPLVSGEVTISCETDIPEKGNVKITIEKAAAPFKLKLRMPRWAAKNGKSYYITHENVQAGDTFNLSLPMKFKTTLYTGGEEIPNKERWAVEYGPLLFAAMGAPGVLDLQWNPEKPEEWLAPLPGDKPGFAIKGDSQHEYRAYLDINDEPFDVYPVVGLEHKYIKQKNCIERPFHAVI